MAAPEAEERRDAMLRLTKPVEDAILEAGHASKILFIEEAVLKTMPKSRLLIVAVGLVPKSSKSWESIIHNEFVVISGRGKPITVYGLEDTLLSKWEFIEKWTSDSNYKLPIGKGLIKLYESKPQPSPYPE